MNQDLKDQLHELAARVEHLIQEATAMCDAADPSENVDSVSSALFNLRRHNDFVYAVTKNEPPGDVIVRIELPDTGETVRLEASWSKDVNSYRLNRVPIELATVARSIDSSLAMHKHTESVDFRWSAIPVELDELIE